VKGQAISMDFIMTFVIYLFALSIFFFGMKDNIDQKTFDVDSELIMDKVSQQYVKGIKVNSLIKKEMYKDLGADACIYLSNGNQILAQFSTYEKTNQAFFGDEPCVSGPVFNVLPHCQSKNSILLTKPVIYNRRIVNLGVLLCK
jgi:hypothetical protein